jgi:hypothetical protein
MEKRVVTNEEIKKYQPMINMFLRDYVAKNWKESSYKKKDKDVGLGNTGMSMEDMKQYLYTELVVALQNYNKDYITAGGLSVKESTFVHQHLFHRIGGLCKKLTKKSNGYGLWTQNFEITSGDSVGEDA